MYLEYYFGLGLFTFFASHEFPANVSVFIVFKINAAKRNNVIVQQYRFTIQMVRFCVGYTFRTAKCMGLFLWDVLDRPIVGLLYTVFSLTLPLFYGASARTRVMVSLSRLHEHTQTNHIRQNASGRVISLTQRPLPDNTQHSQEKDIYESAGFEPTIPAIERPQTRARKQRDHCPRLLTQNLLIFSSQPQPSTHVSSSRKTETERYSNT